ncbi:MAG: phosphatase PAP2 family protein [Bacteroidia bacterium]
MPYVTFIGDGVVFAVIIIILFFIRIRYGLIALFAWLVESTIVQVCKLFIFRDQPRPWKRWSEEYDIYLIEGFKPYSNNSFPSGHTASTFCLFTLLALFVANKKLGLLFLMLALMVAYSRIYLAQHYFIDTYIGAWIGVFSAFIMYLYFNAPKLKFNQRETVLDRPLLKYKK